MRKYLHGLVAAGLLGLVAFGVRAQGEEGGESPSCVSSRGEARYGAYGYDHIVVVRNGCTYATKCRVSTNVNTTPTEVTVAAGAESSVVTFRASPAREFQPNVQCRRQD